MSECCLSFGCFFFIYNLNPTFFQKDLEELFCWYHYSHLVMLRTKTGAEPVVCLIVLPLCGLNTLFNLSEH